QEAPTPLELAVPPPGDVAAQAPPPISLAEDPLVQWEASRQEIFTAAERVTELGAREAVAELPGSQDRFDDLMNGAAGRLQRAMGPAVAGALDQISPVMEALATAQSDYAAVRAAFLVRWRELGGVHEQIAALLDNFEIPDVGAKQILAQRERILAEATLKAERIMAEAQVAAAEAKAAALSQAAQSLEEFEAAKRVKYDELVAQARAAGYQEGRAQADQEGARVIEEAIETLNRARLAYPNAVRENSQKLLDLALAVAEKIVGDEIAARPQTVLHVLEEAMARVTDMDSVVIRVNPDDLPLVEAQESRFRELLAQVKQLEFHGSPKIQRGGVWIETGSGTVDATIKTQLAVVQEVLQKVQRELRETEDVESEAFDELNG
ncbi:MAG: hypothetical protein KGR26_08170, partial [Cyanobacteria bacterium REEB65]|nr:hypothetical protein [Cyanobacteria bacterium REEB65]